MANLPFISRLFKGAFYCYGYTGVLFKDLVSWGDNAAFVTDEWINMQNDWKC